MVPIITVTLKDGKLLHCDHACYQTDSNLVGCICGDRNHGLGLNAAIATNRTAQYAIIRNIFMRYPEAREVNFLLHTSTLEKHKLNLYSHAVHRVEEYPHPIQFEPEPEPKTPPLITLAFREDFYMHCTSVCYSPGSQNRGCLCKERNRGLGLDMALHSNLKWHKQIATETFTRFPASRFIVILLPEGMDCPDTITIFNHRHVPRPNHSFPNTD